MYIFCAYLRTSQQPLPVIHNRRPINSVLRASRSTLPALSPRALHRQQTPERSQLQQTKDRFFQRPGETPGLALCSSGPRPCLSSRPLTTMKEHSPSPPPLTTCVSLSSPYPACPGVQGLGAPLPSPSFPPFLPRTNTHVHTCCRATKDCEDLVPFSLSSLARLRFMALMSLLGLFNDSLTRPFSCAL